MAHLPDLGLARTLGAKPCLVRTGKGLETEASGWGAEAQVFESLVEFSRFLPPLLLGP